MNRDDSVEILKWGEATLVLTEREGVLEGTWTERIVGTTNWTVQGTRTGNRIRLVAREHDGTDPELAIVLRRHWEGTISGDRIEGSLWMTIAGRDRPPVLRPWKAKRTG